MSKDTDEEAGKHMGNLATQKKQLRAQLKRVFDS
jgi:hypothetical protein